MTTLKGSIPGDCYLSGGGLPSTYKAVQFHLHWGSNDTVGSEHTKNGKSYAAEMHIVHYDSVKYESISHAILQPDGLAVLGFWVKIGCHNPAGTPIIRHLNAVRFTHIPYIFLKSAFSILSLLLATNLTRFYRYSGSLTTPGCYESVIWTMFDDEITLSRKQIGLLRRPSNLEHIGYQENPDDATGPQLLEHLHIEQLQDNYRPIQRLWGRKVYQSWPRITNFNISTLTSFIINHGINGPLEDDGHTMDTTLDMTVDMV